MAFGWFLNEAYYLMNISLCEDMVFCFTYLVLLKSPSVFNKKPKISDLFEIVWHKMIL